MSVTLPINLGTRSCDLVTALKEEPWIASQWYKDDKMCIRARVVMETKKDTRAWYMQMDQPISFSPIHRRYSMRGLDREQYVLLGSPVHDPMALL